MADELQMAKDRAVQLFRSGDLSVAEKLCQDILKTAPEDVSMWCLLSSICRQQHKGPEALAHARKAIGLMPDHAQPRFLAGLAFLNLKQPENAIIAFGHALKNQPNHREALMRKGEAHISTRQLAEAKQCFESVLEIDPDEANSLCTLAELMRKTGEAEGALEYIKKILVKNPQTPVAHLVAARAEVALEKFDDAEKRLNGMLNRHTPTAIKAGTAKLLGDVYDAKKDYEKAFENYAVGQESSESHNRTRIDEDSVVDDLKRRSAIIDAVDVSEWGPIDDGLADPVFVIGAPRSGISLVEQILCAHSNCVTSNQRPYLSDTILTSPNHSSSQEKYPECLAEWDDESVRKIRQSYWQRVDQFIPDRGNKVLIDKTPMGIADVAFIRRVFPGAPVIHVVRDPRDVCLSCFKEVIDYDLITVLFSQLERTARVYSLMLECGIKASEVLGINLLEVRYEKLVDGFDESRKIVEFIGQTWEPELENFVGVAHEKYVLDLCGETARPLHRNSINRWKHYESKLQPIMPLLADLIERLGY